MYTVARVGSSSGIIISSPTVGSLSEHLDHVVGHSAATNETRERVRWPSGIIAFRTSLWSLESVKVPDPTPKGHGGSRYLHAP